MDRQDRNWHGLYIYERTFEFTQRKRKSAETSLRCHFPQIKKKKKSNIWKQGCKNALVHACSVVQLCPILCDLMDCSLPDRPHGIFQARIQERVAMASSRVSSRPRDQICISSMSCTGRWILYHWATWEAQECSWTWPNRNVSQNDKCIFCVTQKLPLRIHLTDLTAHMWNERSTVWPCSETAPHPSPLIKNC